MKIISVSVASLLLASVLAGCSGPSGQECTSLANSGPAVDSVDVTGGFGESPTVTFPTPLETTTTERKLLIEGDGAPARPGGSVTLDFAIYNGETRHNSNSTGPKYGTKLQSGDIIGVAVDMVTGTLTYYRNG